MHTPIAAAGRVPPLSRWHREPDDELQGGPPGTDGTLGITDGDSVHPHSPPTSRVMANPHRCFMRDRHAVAKGYRKRR